MESGRLMEGGRLIGGRLIEVALYLPSALEKASIAGNIGVVLEESLGRESWIIATPSF